MEPWMCFKCEKGATQRFVYVDTYEGRIKDVPTCEEHRLDQKEV